MGYRSLASSSSRPSQSAQNTCTEPAPHPAAAAARICVEDGTKKTFKVTAVEKDALVGQDVRVAYQDMTSLRVQTESASGNKTAWIVVGVLAVAAVAAAAGGGGGGSSY